MAWQTVSNGVDIPLVTIICSWLFVFFTLIAILVQAYMCASIRHGVDRGDVFLFVAAFAAVFLVVLTTWAIIDEGQGVHVDEDTSSQIKLVAKSLLANEVLWRLVNSLVRISGLTLVQRFISTQPSQFFANMMIIASAAYFTALFLEALLICRPISASWDPKINGSCGDQVAAYLALEVCGLVIDIGIIFLPLPLIWRLTVDHKTKISTSIIFSLGILVLVVTGLRLQAIHRVNTVDFTYNEGYLGLLSSLGSLAGVIACCAPSIKSFIIHHVYKGKKRRRRWFHQYTTIRYYQRSNGVLSTHPTTTIIPIARGANRRTQFFDSNFSQDPYSSNPPPLFDDIY